MKTNTYEQWDAHEHLPDSFYLNELNYEKGVMKMTFKEFIQSEGKQFAVTFKNCLSYRITQESLRLKSLEDSSLKSFNKTTKSEFISWVRNEALGIYDDRPIVQYTIVNLDSIIDVICEQLPTAEWI